VPRCFSAHHHSPLSFLVRTNKVHTLPASSFIPAHHHPSLSFLVRTNKVHTLPELSYVSVINFLPFNIIISSCQNTDESMCQVVYIFLHWSPTNARKSFHRPLLNHYF